MTSQQPAKRGPFGHPRITDEERTRRQRDAIAAMRATYRAMGVRMADESEATK